MKHTILPIFFFLTFTISCSERKQELKQEYTHEIILDIKNAKDISELKKITESEYLILETPNETDYIGTFDKVIQKGDKIVILDETKQTIWVYNLDGTLYSKINRSGEGPEEYRNIRDIHYDEEKESVYIWDGGVLLYLYEYSLTGKFKSKIFFQVYADHFYIHDTIVLFGSFSANFLNDKQCNKYIHKFTKDGTYLDSHFEIPEKLVHKFTTKKNIFTGNDDICFIPEYSETVYSLDSNLNFCNYISIGFTDKTINSEPITISPENRKKTRKSLQYGAELTIYGNYVKNIEVIYETNSHIAFNFRHKRIAYTAVYNKISRKTTVFLHNTYYYDMSLKPFSYTEDAFISIDDPSILEDVDPKSIINYESIKEKGLGSVINQVVIYNKIIE
jgi:hypothetical protein